MKDPKCKLNVPTVWEYKNKDYLTQKSDTSRKQTMKYNYALNLGNRIL